MIDVLIVGGGPAGSTVGGILASRGWQVEIVDRATFPRPKPCGEFVNPGAVGLLEELRLADRIRALSPAEVDNWTLCDEAGSATTASFGHANHGWGISRTRLDAALLGAARARGAEVTQGVRVTDLTAGSAPTVLGFANRVPWTKPARLVIGADGLRSVVASRLGTVRRKPRLRKLSITCHLRWKEPPPYEGGRLWISDRRTVGTVPIRSDRTTWNVTVVGDARRDGPSASRDRMGFFRDVVRNAGLPVDRFTSVVGGPWTSGPFDRPVAPPAGPGYLLVGDAAGYYDPLTGQGIFRALRSAQLAAEAADRWLRGEQHGRNGPAGYARALRRAFAPGRAVQHLIEAAIQATPSRRFVFRRLSARSRAASALLRVTGDVAPARSLLGPRSWFPLLLPGDDGPTGMRPRHDAGEAPARTHGFKRGTEC